VCVKNESGAWKYDDNYSYYSFTPAESDVLVAQVSFTNDTATALAGQNSTENGIALGYASGNLAFYPDQWGGSPNEGEFYITGTSFTPNMRVTARKYYEAGGQRVAMRENGTLYYLLSDHLGSTTIAANGNGTKHSEQRYKAWGEQRFPEGESDLPTDRRFTGQVEENSGGLGLYFYNARWYDPYITQFNQPDSIIPDPYNSLDWNRYSYARYNPVRFNDPTGYCPEPKNGKASENGCWRYWKQLSEKYPNVSIDPLAFSKAQLKVIAKSLHIARAAFEGQENFAKAVGSFGITTANSPLHKLGAGGMAPPGLSYIYLVSDYFSNVRYQVNTILHEIGHIFDFHGSGPGLDPMHYKSQEFVDRFAPGCDVGYFGCVNETSSYAPYNLGGASSGYSGFNEKETTGYGANSSIDDFAETFAAYAWLSVDMDPVNPVGRGRIRLMRLIIQRAIR
jgi:RHS repeat-associated protein